MALTAPVSKTFDLTPAGNHVARLYQIVHIGTVKDSYMGEEKETDKIRLAFELSNERKVFNEGEEPRPFSISREFTFSMGTKANLRKFVEGMHGVALHDEEAAGFDLEQLLGDACLLSVVHKESASGKTYALIQGASPLPKGMDAPAQVNEGRLIDVNTATQEEIEALPEFIRDKMKSSKEYDERFRSAETVNDHGIKDGDIPF